MQCRLRHLAILGVLAAVACAAPPPAAPGPGPHARGVVFHDRDRDGIRGEDESGIGGVLVSNGVDVTRTDRSGRYALPVSESTILFVVKPPGYTPPRDANQIPRFHYVHNPAGSPANLSFPGVAPTGPLPDSIDFALTETDESESFSALIFGDTQPYDLEEVDFVSRDLIEPLIGAEAAFGMTLGDLVGDDLSLFDPLNRAIGRLGIPWHHVIGNHDINFRAPDDATSDDTYESIYGPGTYAFQVGRTHFFVLDNVRYEGWDAENAKPGRYVGALSGNQLAFVRNTLAYVPRDDLVVLTMHIPLGGLAPFEIDGRRELLEILSGHPRTLSFSSHTHIQYQSFFGAEDGYAAGTHHHWNQAAAAGSWWQGEPDEVGVPHATMRCGAPNGYSLLHVDGAEYRIEFRAARRPASHQMNVIAPDSVPVGDLETEVLVNVFAGSERTRVELRVGDTDWSALERVARPDPLYGAILAREKDRPGRRGYKLPPPMDSPHLWAGRLPAGLAPGTHAIEVHAEDPAGLDATARRLIRITP